MEDNQANENDPSYIYFEFSLITIAIILHFAIDLKSTKGRYKLHEPKKISKLLGTTAIKRNNWPITYSPNYITA